MPAAEKGQRDIEAIISKARPRESSVTICVAGDLAGEYEELDAELVEVREAPVTSLSGNPRAVEIAERMAALRTQMQDSEATFRFRALSRKQWSDLRAAHAPRPGEDESVNMDTFPVALVSACSIEPEMDVAQAGRLADALSQGAWNDLFSAAWRANTSDGSIPFSPAASATLLISEQS